MYQFRIRSLCPAPRGWIEFIREYAHGNRDRDALGVEIPFAKILPVKTGAGKRGVRQPSDRDVVEDVVARKAFGLALKNARDQLVAARVMIKEVCREADRRIRDTVQRLRTQPHLEPVSDALLVDELQTLVSELLVG